MKFKKILLSLLICLSCFVQAKNITISRLTCEMQEGLVVVEGSPRLGWVMESPENGTRQSAYEIDIREAFTGRSVWNSGKVYSSQSQLVSTKGADYDHDIIHYPGRTNPTCRQELRGSLQSYYPNADEARSIL
jgi:alpha-L-rhamnosidase